MNVRRTGLPGRSCPSCRKSWPADRVTCPDCLVDLVDDPDATVRCSHCGREWPATMVSCPVCLAELRLDPAAAAEALGTILSLGGRLYRPDGVAPFADGPACTLLRLAARSSLVFTGPTELVEATVAGPQGRAEAPMVCYDHDDSVYFRLLAYEPAQQGLVAVGPDGAAVATYLRAGRGIEVRDETSAPVATLTPTLGDYELVETGGGVLATVRTADMERDGWIDDQWSLEPAPGGRSLPLRLPAAVGLVLAAKALLGRPAPVQAWGEHNEPDASQPWTFD